jgi:transcriptional regulator with XRE-family HTH domain
MTQDSTFGPPQAFGLVLQRERTRREISQETLAFEAGVDRTFVSRMERGLRQPTISTLLNLAKAIGMPAAELVQLTERELRLRQKK